MNFSKKKKLALLIFFPTDVYNIILVHYEIQYFNNGKLRDKILYILEIFDINKTKKKEINKYTLGLIGFTITRLKVFQ